VYAFLVHLVNLEQINSIKITGNIYANIEMSFGHKKLTTVVYEKRNNIQQVPNAHTLHYNTLSILGL
jgi:hypothetical protein